MLLWIPLSLPSGMGISQQFIYIYIYYILKNATKIENNLFKIRNIPPLLEAIYIYIYKHQHTFYRECLLKNVIILQKFSEKRTQLIWNFKVPCWQCSNLQPNEKNFTILNHGIFYIIWCHIKIFLKFPLEIHVSSKLAGFQKGEASLISGDNDFVWSFSYKRKFCSSLWYLIYHLFVYNAIFIYSYRHTEDLLLPVL